MDFPFQICDFGPYRALIIPPTCIEIVRKKSSVRKNTSLILKPVDWLDWTPVLVLANCKSGSKEGECILSKFRGFLNPVQVIDLGRKAPEIALELCVLLDKFKSKIETKILVAGGDGTVGWVLNTIAKLDLTNQPAVGIIPLGKDTKLMVLSAYGRL